MLEIYATSIDYDPHAEASVQFFKQVQNKMHWAAHKHTAAEVIYQRADAEKENMGLTSWSGDTIHRSDVEVAKNYLSEAELDALNKIVTAYLDIAEVHALNQEPMYMADMTAGGKYIPSGHFQVIVNGFQPVLHIHRLSKRLMLNMINIKTDWRIAFLRWREILLKTLEPWK